jgi:hypothetical protein
MLPLKKAAKRNNFFEQLEWQGVKALPFFIFYITFQMFRLFLISLSCAAFIACSSNDSEVLKEWFGDQGIDISYGMQPEDIEVDVTGLVSNDAASLTNLIYSLNPSVSNLSYLALGSVNGIENSLYFDLETSSSLPENWKFATDSVFYADFYNSAFPNEQKNMSMNICWLIENNTKENAEWLEFSESFGNDCGDVTFRWEAGENNRDSIIVSPLPNFPLNSKLLIRIKSLSEDGVLRISTSSATNISGMQRIAQTTNIISISNRNNYLHSGARDSLYMSLKIGDKIKDIGKGRAVVFGQLILPKNPSTCNESAYPLPVLVHGRLSDSTQIAENDYRVDTSYVKEHSHQNLVFNDGDYLTLEVTRSLRHYNTLQSTFDFVLRLGASMLLPNSPYFSNYTLGGVSHKVFADRPVYSCYDFSNVLNEKAILRLWFAK